MMRRKAFVAAVALATTTGFLGTSDAAPYSLTKIADSESSHFLGSFFGSASINDVGQIAFESSGKIYRADHFISLIAEPTNDLFGFSGTNIASSGVVGLRAFGNSGFQAIVSAGLGSLSTVATNSTGEFSSFGGSPWLNSNSVAFSARVDDSTPEKEGVYRLTGPIVTPIAVTHSLDPSSDFTSFGSVTPMNELGTVAFLGTTSYGAGIFSGNGTGAAKLIVNTAGEFSAFGSPGSINEAGDVATNAFWDDGRRGIIVGDGTNPLRVIAASSTPGIEFSHPTITDQGAVAYEYHVLTGSLLPFRDGTFIEEIATGGIVVSDGITSEEIISIGDELDGRTVMRLDLFTQGMNDARQVVFRAFMDNGNVGIYRADPLSVEVPEPRSVIVLCTSLLGVFAFAGAQNRAKKRTQSRFTPAHNHDGGRGMRATFIALVAAVSVLAGRATAAPITLAFTRTQASSYCAL